MLAELANLNCYLACFVIGCRSCYWTQTRRRTARRRLNGARQSFNHAEETIREGENDGDERDTDDQLPNVGQATGEIGARDLDADRSDDSTDDGASAAQRDHDDQSGSEGEAGILGCCNPTNGGITEAGEGRDNAGDDQDDDAVAPRIDAEIGAALVIVAHRLEETAGVATHHNQRHHSHRSEAEARQAKPVVELQLEALKSDQPA